MSTIKILVLIIIIKMSYGFEANLFLNLSKIEEKSNSTIGTYKSNYVGKVFPLHLKPDWDIVLEVIYSDTLTEMPFFASQKLVNVKIGDKTWNLMMTFASKNNKACKTILQIDEMKVDNILNESFECQSQVTGYISRFYNTKNENFFLYYTAYGSKKPFYQEIFVHWVIEKKDFFLIDNEQNFKNFLKECNFTPYLHYVQIFVCALGILIILINAALLLAKKVADYRRISTRRILNPIIMVRPAPENVCCH